MPARHSASESPVLMQVGQVKTRSKITFIPVWLLENCSGISPQSFGPYEDGLGEICAHLVFSLAAENGWGPMHIRWVCMIRHAL